MSLRDFKFAQITDFKGAWTQPEASDVPLDRALISNNSEYQAGQVRPRTGFGEFWDNSEPVTSIANWIRHENSGTIQGNSLIYFNPTTTKARLIYNLATPATANSELFTAAGGYALSVAQLGNRAYMATFNTSQVGVAQARVANIYVAEIQLDKCFVGPLTTKPTLTEPSAGVVTAGVHRVGYMVQTRSGYRGCLSPVLAGTNTFDITSAITSSGGLNIQFDLTATWPTEAMIVYPVMTPSTDLNSFYIPPAWIDGQGVVGGTSFAVSFALDISDDDLVATGINVTDQMNLLTQASNGTGPFSPHHVFEYGSRMGYATILANVPCIFISDPYKPQQITADQHLVKLPGDRQCLSTFTDRGVLYVLGPHWTYAFTDNNQVPAEWPEPQLIDGSIGTLSIRGVSQNPSKGITWVAARGGLYLFAGQYAQQPISARNDDYWRRINWAAAHTLEVIDQATEQRVMVKCALDDETAANWLLVWDYSDGVGADEVSFSAWFITGVSIGSAAIVENVTTKRLELWVGGATAGPILRQKNVTEDDAYSDDGTAVDWQYRTALLPNGYEPMASIFAHHGDHVRCQGAGTLKMQLVGLDAVNTHLLSGATLSETPGSYALNQSYFLSPAASIDFSLGGAGEYAIVSALKHYYKEKYKFS